MQKFSNRLTDFNEPPVSFTSLRSHCANQATKVARSWCHALGSYSSQNIVLALSITWLITVIWLIWLSLRFQLSGLRDDQVNAFLQFSFNAFSRKSIFPRKNQSKTDWKTKWAPFENRWQLSSLKQVLIGLAIENLFTRDRKALKGSPDKYLCCWSRQFIINHLSNLMIESFAETIRVMSKYFAKLTNSFRVRSAKVRDSA